MYVITRSAKFVQNLEMTGTSEMAGTRKRACLLRFVSVILRGYFMTERNVGRLLALPKWPKQGTVASSSVCYLFRVEWQREINRKYLIPIRFFVRAFPGQF